MRAVEAGKRRTIGEYMVTRLPNDERSELARELVESLEANGSPGVRDAWNELISRRAQQVLDGAAPTADLEKTLDGIEMRLRRAAG